VLIAKLTVIGVSSSLVGARTGRSPISSDCSAIRAVRCDARTEENVAIASTNVRRPC